MFDDRGAQWAMLAEVVDAVEADLDVLVASVEDRIAAPARGGDSGQPTALHRALRRAVAAAVRDALARLRSQTELPQELLPDLIELARVCADSHCELPELAGPWLAGQEIFWDHFQTTTERTLTDTAQCWDVIKAARGRLKGHGVHLNELFRAAYERQSTHASGIDVDSPLRAVLRALGGQWVDPGELGYDLACDHIAVVADDSPLLDAAVRRTERQLLRVQAPDGATWAWLGGRSRISDEDIDALIGSQDSSDGIVAFGEPGEGIAGFAASHHQALEARAIAVATNQSAVRFADLRVLIAVLRDSALAKGFVERELGELDRPSERMDELRVTLRVYLEHSQSVSTTALLRRRDRKTIERQLRSAEQLIHHPVSDRSEEVLIALRVSEILRHRD